MTELILIQKIILMAIALIFAITVHETAHGWVANRLGDPTAKMLGRLTLNPLKHIDPIGTVILPVALFFIGGFIFGYAKPVPVTWQNLRHPRRDMALVALAGPGSNLIMALLWGFVAKLSTMLPVSVGGHLGYMGAIGVYFNVILLVLNLIPIPPLDGSRVVSAFLRGRAAHYYAAIEPYGFFILLGLLAIGALGNFMMPLVMKLNALIFSFFGLSL